MPEGISHNPENSPKEQTHQERAAEKLPQPSLGHEIVRIGSEYTKKPTKQAFSQLMAGLIMYGLSFAPVEAQEKKTPGPKPPPPIVLKNWQALPDSREAIQAEGIWNRSENFDRWAPIPGREHVTRDKVPETARPVRVLAETLSADFAAWKKNPIRLMIGRETFLIDSLQNKPDTWHDPGRLERLPDGSLELNLFSSDQNNYLRVMSAEEQEAFRTFIHQQVELYLQARDEKTLHDNPRLSPRELQAISEARNREFKAGSIKVATDALQSIFDTHFHYDPVVEKNLAMTDQGRPYVVNPTTSMASADGSSSAEILMHQKPGVCRHAAEMYVEMFKELKKLYRQNFQHTYITPLRSAFKGHEYTLIYQLRPNEIAVSAYDPLNPHQGHANPAFELLKTLYFRNALSHQEFYEAAAQFFAQGGSGDNGDIFALLDLALSEIHYPHTPSSGQAAETTFRLVTQIAMAQLERDIEQSPSRVSSPEVQQRLRALAPYRAEYQRRYTD